MLFPILHPTEQEKKKKKEKKLPWRGEKKKKTVIERNSPFENKKKLWVNQQTMNLEETREACDGNQREKHLQNPGFKYVVNSSKISRG